LIVRIPIEFVAIDAREEDVEIEVSMRREGMIPGRNGGRRFLREEADGGRLAEEGVRVGEFLGRRRGVGGRGLRPAGRVPVRRLGTAHRVPYHRSIAANRIRLASGARKTGLGDHRAFVNDRALLKAPS